jgi:hypothetical protein
VPKKVTGWVPNQLLATGVLAWRAAYPELRRRATPWWGPPLRALRERRHLGTGAAHGMSTDVSGTRLRAYSIAVDAAAGRLDQEETATLRQSGTLPVWFFDAVEDERRACRRVRR